MHNAQLLRAFHVFNAQFTMHNAQLLRAFGRVEIVNYKNIKL